MTRWRSRSATSKTTAASTWSATRSSSSGRSAAASSPTWTTPANASSAPPRTSPRPTGRSPKVEFLQHVPAVHNTEPWITATLPTIERVVGADHIVQAPPGLGYDDVSVFVNRYGGTYLQLGAQDFELHDDGSMTPIPGGRGIVMNHNAAFYADDSVLQTGVQLHANVALDHLTGQLEAHV